MPIKSLTVNKISAAKIVDKIIEIGIETRI
jgi:hypothetical protein